MVAMKITATEQAIKDVFDDKYYFEIPSFQRPYAWTTEQVDELLDDLTDSSSRNGEAPYFLGSIVLIKDDDDPRSRVVDGQQRLTTITLMFCVLRYLSNDDRTRRELDDLIRQEGNRVRGTEDRYRLRIRDRDSDFFQQHIQEMGKLENFMQSDPVDFSDSRRLMFENVTHLHRELVKLDEDARNELATYITKNCFLVIVTASDEESAYRIFSVMNDRGLDLSPTDILKATIIGKINRHEEVTYTNKWEDIEVELGRDGFRDLFAHMRMIYKKDKLRGSLQKEFQEEVLPNALDHQESVDFIERTLEPFGKVYQVVSNASYESTHDAERVNVLLRYLRRLDNFDWIPPAMAYFNQGHDSNRLLEFTRDLERLAYGLFIMRANINERINRYARVLRAIENGDSLYSENDESPSLQLSTQEKAHVLQGLSGEVYRQTRVRMPLLLRLDSLLADAGANYQHPVISIEHVLPQSPTGQWLEWFPDADEREQWTHRIANLVLLSHRRNSSASNYEFERKKERYFLRNGSTPFVLTSQVANQLEWTPAVLKRRQGELVNALKTEWRLG